VSAPAATRRLTCRDCRQPFTLTADEVAWFTSRELYVPVRCRACRAMKRDGRQAPSR
jgi:RNase P subunit RPR2